jgi:(1->4)-alpha-D-glucan 1-alpha-D-glucosylmutase
VPDIYQGDELETLSLVDPDNRRPVDWKLRERLLVHGGDPKQRLTQQALELRARRAEAFAGGYEPVDLGPDVCAFTRGGEVLVAVSLRPGAEVRVPAPWREVAKGLYER